MSCSPRTAIAATSLDAVAARANVTKGAVYHHFDGKRQLFEAVFAREVASSPKRFRRVRRKKDPWDAFHAGCRAFWRSASSRGCSGSSCWTRSPRSAGRRCGLEAPLLDAMGVAIARAVEAGRIAPRPAGPLAHFLFGALCEMAMVVARAENQRAAHRKAVTELGRIMAALAS